MSNSPRHCERKRSNPEKSPAAGYWIASALKCLAMTISKHKSAFPRRVAPELCFILDPPEELRAQGMPGDGLAHGPPAAKKAGGSDHRFSRIIRHSLRDGLRLIRALPGVHDLLVTVACELITSQTWRQPRGARTTRLRRPHQAARLAARRVHRIPPSTFVTIAKRPSCADR